MKRLIIISTGRCGTKRVSEILTQSLKATDIRVNHQTGISRLANILGNLMYYLGSSEYLKKWLSNRQLGGKSERRIMTDPLMSMCIPDEMVKDENTFFLHVNRPCENFGISMFALTRKRPFSFIAHNFIPFWQPGLWPLENVLNPSIINKYATICRKKNDFFERHYSKSPNYLKVDMHEVFSEGFLNRKVVEIFGVDLNISSSDLKQKSNQST